MLPAGMVFSIVKEGENMEKLITPTEIAERYGVALSTVWRWLREKKLPAIRVGKHYRITESDLATFEATFKT